MTSKHQWSEQSIDACKLEVKRELDAIESERGVAGRASTILSRIGVYEEKHDGPSILKLYIYLVSALVLQTRHEYLNEQRWLKMIELARSLLKAQGIKAQSSRLSFLWGELHFVQSQLERQRGENWQAAWHQFMGYHVTRGQSPGGEGFQKFSMGSHALRLSHSRLALHYFQEAEPHLQGPLLEVCLLNQAICSRYLGERATAREILSRLESNPKLSEKTARACEWERLLLALIENQDLGPIMSACRKGHSHYKVSYICDYALLAMAYRSKRWLELLPSLGNLRRRKDLTVSKNDQFLAMCLHLQEAYDGTLPLNQRLQTLGQDLAQCHQLFTIEQELLYWAAASRWLLRIRNQDLLQLSRQEYESKCLRLSEGRTADIFNFWVDENVHEMGANDEEGTLELAAASGSNDRRGRLRAKG